MYGKELIENNRISLADKIIDEGRGISFDIDLTTYSKKFKLNSNFVTIISNKFDHEIIKIILNTYNKEYNIPIDDMDSWYLGEVKDSLRSQYYWEITNDIEIFTRLNFLCRLISENLYDIKTIPSNQYMVVYSSDLDIDIFAEIPLIGDDKIYLDRIVFHGFKTINNDILENSFPDHKIKLERLINEKLNQIS